MSEIHYLSELFAIPDLSDIHLFLSSAPATENKIPVMSVRTRIAGDISEIKTVQIDIPEIFCARSINLNIQGKLFRLRITSSESLGNHLLFIRVLPNNAPPIEDVGAQYFFEKIHDRDSLGSGLILVAGRAGSGKSTFIASVLQHCITHFPIHVVTLEDPIEYLFNPQKGYATQKEISFDSPSFEEALRLCMREDPDVLFIGEVRDRETAITALNAAESGHLVFGTIHAGSNAGIVDRLMGLLGNNNPDFTAQQVSQCLRMCLHIERTGMSFRYKYAEINTALKNIIRNRALHLWDQHASPITKKGGKEHWT
jgi:Tfp pilus assembly pilus retraction ATPase PilT